MKKTFLLLLCFTAIICANAQSSKSSKKKKQAAADSVAKANAMSPTVLSAGAPPKKDWSKVNVSKRAADHFMIQYGSDIWLNRPDSVKTKGFSRHFNFFVMLDKPFKSDVRFSLAYGIGINTSNMFFDKVEPNVYANSPTMPFPDVSKTNHFDKFKLTTFYVTAPIELRYYSNPENTNKSWKFAVGAKVGLLMKAYTKGKNLLDKNSNSIYGTTYIEKEQNKRFINGTLVTGTARVGYGFVSLNVDYQITPVLKSGFGPNMNTLSIGLTLSGL
jgi:hypothetical protein